MMIDDHSWGVLVCVHLFTVTCEWVEVMVLAAWNCWHSDQLWTLAKHSHG